MAKIVELFKGLGKLILLLGALVGIGILMLLAGVIFFGAWGLIMEFIDFIGDLLSNWWVFGGILVIVFLYSVITEKVKARDTESNI